MGRIAHTSADLADSTAALLADSVVWDNHTCTTIRPGHADSLAQLARHKVAGADVVCLNVGFDPAPVDNAIVLLAEFREWLRANSDNYLLVEESRGRRTRAPERTARCLLQY